MTQPPQTNSSGNTASEQQAVSSVSVENAVAVAALLLLEKQAIELTSGPLRKLLSDVFRTMAGRYVLMFGGLDHPADPLQTAQLTALLAQELNNLRQYDPAAPLRAAAIKAADAGTAFANKYMVNPYSVDPNDFPDAVEQTIQQAKLAVADAVDSAQEFAEQTPVTGWDDVVKQMGKASQAATGLERRTAFAVAASHAESIRKVAAARGASLLWVAEPDACVVCLALSGHVVDPSSGDGFDEEATFGKPMSAPDPWPPGQPLMGPPRHVNCRCVCEIWIGPSIEPGGPADTSLYDRPGVGAKVDLPAALRREAKRSIVYGWSLPSESGVVRLDAADRLLKAGAGLPRTVEAKGRAAVKAGKFDNRVHPSKRRTARRPK